MAEVEADAGAVEIVLDEVHDRARARQLVRDHFDGDPHAERLRDPQQLLDAAPRRRPRIAGALAALRARDAEVRHQHRHRQPPRDVQRLFGLAHRMRARVGIGARQRQRAAPASAGEALRRSARGCCAAPAPPRRATLADPRSPTGCGSRSASASRRPRRTRSRARRSPAGDPGTVAARDRDASRLRTGVLARAESLILSQFVAAVTSTAVCFKTP